MRSQQGVAASSSRGFGRNEGFSLMLPDFRQPTSPAMRMGCSRLIAAGASLAAAAASAQSPLPPADATLDPLVITATRRSERSLDVPASIDVIGQRDIQQQQPMVNLSETLVR